MQTVNIEEYQEEIILHFGGKRSRINAYTLASTLVSLADAVKEANAIVNPGYEVEVLVEAFGEGSFRAKVKASYTGLNNLFNSNRLEAIAIGIFTSFIYQHTLAPDNDVTVKVDDTQVVIEQGDKRIVVPKNVYEAQKEVEKSEKFRRSVSAGFLTIEKDENITDFGITKGILDEIPDILVPRERFPLLSKEPDLAEPLREVQEVADLQIKRAILERSKRKWEFIWRGVKISAPVLDEKFYEDFFAHRITVAPGDAFEVLLKIYQTRDEDTGIYTNSRYEVVEVQKHTRRQTQPGMDI